MSAVKVAFLSNMRSPILVPLVRAFERAGVPVDCVFLDSKEHSQKNLNIWEERTGGAFGGESLYDCEAAGIPCFAVTSPDSEAALDLVRGRGISLLVNAGVQRILRAATLEAPRIGVLNCHPGLLPMYRGCTAVEWAIYEDRQVGNTVHLMSESIDDGPIVLREGLRFAKADTYRDIRNAVYRHGFDLMARAAALFVDDPGAVERLEQPGEGKYYDVIDDEAMRAVLSKIENGDYAYQD